MKKMISAPWPSMAVGMPSIGATMLARSLLCLVLLVAGQDVARAQSLLSAPSTWKGPTGKLDLQTLAANGRFTGVLTSIEAGFACANQPFDVAGMLSGNVVTFVVTWKLAAINCNTVTIWRGTIVGSTIKVQSQSARGDMASGKIVSAQSQIEFQKVQ